MDNSQLELIKENVQPLKCGRKVDSLRAIINMDDTEMKKREETRQEFEKKLESASSEEEKLDVYYNYINWIEQNYPNGGKDANLKNIFEKCIQHYYKKDDFKNSEKLLTIFLKYTNILNNPLELFNYFYKSGFAKRLAQFYISWSFFYETQDNFKRALKVIEAGIHNGAQPVSELQKTLNDLQVRTMRHVVSHPDDEKDNQRKALNSLKAKVDRHGKAEAPVMRVGNSVIQGKGLKVLSEKPLKTKAEQLNILCDENEEPPIIPHSTDSTMPLATRTPATVSDELAARNQENERDPGKWNENKLTSKGLRTRRPATTAGSAFEILEDPEEKAATEPQSNPQSQPAKKQVTEKPKSTTNGRFKEHGDFPVARFQDESEMKKFTCFHMFGQMYKNNTEYSFEELRFEKWFESRNNKQENSKDESSSVSRSIGNMSDTETTMAGATSIVRDFYNGTLATTVLNDSSRLDNQTTLVREKYEEVVARVPNEKFEIFSETTDRLNCTTVGSPTNNQPANNYKPSINEDEFVTKPVEFTISMLKEDQFNSCSSSTPCRTFRRPIINQPPKTFSNHPNFVYGITSKLSPIVETSREINKTSSSSSGMNSTGGQYITGKSILFSETTNPFDNNFRTKLLSKLSEPFDFRPGYLTASSALPTLKVGYTFVFGSKVYVPALEIAPKKNSITIFMIYTDEKEGMEDFATFHTVKYCNNLTHWDFYIRDELNRRLAVSTNGADIKLSLMQMRENIFYKNGYLSLHDDIPFASLKQAIDKRHKSGHSFPETLMKFFILELMLIISKLHECNIIHADICAENIFIFNIIDLPDFDVLDSKTQTLRLADFSQSIDMRLLPEGSVFNKNYTEKKYLSFLNAKSWSYSLDWLDFLNCIHQMCFAIDMQIVLENSKWKLSQPFTQPEKLYLNDLFDLLLNLGPDQKPDLKRFINDIVKHLKVWYYDLADEYYTLKDLFNIV